MRVQRIRSMAMASVALTALLGASDARGATTANLIANGDAETQRCTNDWTAETSIPGWRVLRGAASALCYSAFAWVGETPATPNGADQGRALFAAPGADTAMEQRVDVSAAAAAIDHGGVSYDLSGWLGGVDARPERATLTAVFLDASGAATADPVVIADADARSRGYKTGLVARDRQGPVPAGTRAIVVTLGFVSGPTSFNNALADNIRLTLSGDVGALAPRPATPPMADVPPLDHVFVLMMENTNYSDVINLKDGHPTVTSHMPYLASLAAKGVLLTNTWGTYHPSDQNYVAMVAGDTFKLGAIYFPDFDLPRNHIGDLLEAKGKTWGGYVQGMNIPCDLRSGPTWDPNFAPDDEPFAQFKDVIDNPARCQRSLRDLNDFLAAARANSLPSFAWLAADGYYDGEGAWYVNYSVPFSLSTQDGFIKSALSTLLNSDAWKNSRSLVVVTWDETDGWGWPDNHVPTILIGSPGLLREGTVNSEHFDGYGILRTAEIALGIPDLNRFDRFAQPLTGVFAQNAPRAWEGGEIQPSLAATTRGGLADTFGQSEVPASVDQGQPLILQAPPGFDSQEVVEIEPLGTVPNGASISYPIGSSGAVSIPTQTLAPGFYDVWTRVGSRPPRRAPVPVIVLPPAGISASKPGVEILGAPLDGTETNGTALQVKEGANFIVRYCGGAGATAANSWVGIFVEGTPVSQMTQANANVIGNWLYTPGIDSVSRCGEAEAYPAELASATDYRVYLFVNDANGVATPVGVSAPFRLLTALPH